MSVRCFVLALFLGLDLAHSEDPLPSWRETAPKKAILSFVERVTKPGSSDFVSIPERIAAFDNDGTLWCEQPCYFQGFFVVSRIRALASAHPEWSDQEPFASVLKGDLKAALAGGEKALDKLIMASHAGMTSDEFAQIVAEWLNSAKHPTYGRPFTECVYQPMLELLDYLRSRQFKTFIVSGGGVEFIRGFAEKTYGIPPEQVIGNSIKTRFEMREGKPVIVREAEIDFIDDGPGKPVGIAKFMGRRPLMAFGNSDGDLQMLQYTTSSDKPHLALLVHHTDPVREYAYDRQSPIGKLDKALDVAEAEHWVVVSMKDDWSAIFPPPK